MPILIVLVPILNLPLVMLALHLAIGNAADRTSDYQSGPSDCSEMEAWNHAKWMCEPLAMADMPMSMAVIHGNAFFGVHKVDEPRGGSQIASTNMLMGGIGTSMGNHHYLNAEAMLSVEKWTEPQSGYVETAQVGDYHQDGQPFVDHQHPHSSPVMGLTLSDSISFGIGKSFIKFFVAPRGESTDGPVAFMHRPTAAVNPATPLSHHIGQDSGHISSTVLGADLGIGDQRLEFSVFIGLEPSPTKVDLPIGKPNSYASRLTLQFSPNWFVMGSFAYIRNPDPHVPLIDHYSRISASMYNVAKLSSEWAFYNSLIYGLVRNPTDDGAFNLGFFHTDCVGIVPPTKPGEKPLYPPLNSIVEEFLFDSSNSRFWGRLEFLQHTPYDVEVFNDPDPTAARWISALTIGYTHNLAKWDGLAVDLGASFTKTFLPTQFQQAYGGNPNAEIVFLQIHGMQMTDLFP